MSCRRIPPSFVDHVFLLLCLQQFAILLGWTWLSAVLMFKSNSEYGLSLNKSLKWFLLPIYWLKLMWNIFESHHFTAWEDVNSTNWPRSQCVPSQLSWLSIALVSWRSQVRIPLKPWHFQASSFQLLKINWKIYCDDHSSLFYWNWISYLF